MLLDYRTEDNKENTFEVSLFAELFNEMLMRDSGFRLYKSVLQAVDSKSSTTTTSDTDKHSKVSFFFIYFLTGLFFDYFLINGRGKMAFTAQTNVCLKKDWNVA